MIFAWINFAILLMISLVHFFWALGGKWGAAAAIPQIKGAKVFSPGVFATLVVALIFLGMAALYLAKLDLLPIKLPIWLYAYGLWAMAIVFLIRAIGEFRYVGFFKTEKSSLFARLDTRFYSPLCLLVAFNTLMILLFDI